MLTKIRRMIIQEINKTAKSKILRRLEDEQSESHNISVPKFNALVEREVQLLKVNSANFAIFITLSFILSNLILTLLS